MNPRYQSRQGERQVSNPQGIGGLGIAPLVPILAIAVPAITTAILSWIGRKKPAQKVATTEIANETERYMKANLAWWMNESGKTSEEQKQAISNFNLLWQDLVIRCSDPAMGTPGKWCIQDRDDIAPSQFPWFDWYLKPIQNDPEVVDKPGVVESVTGTVSNVFSNILGGGGGVGMDWGVLVIVGLVGAALLIGGGGGSRK